MDTWALQRAAEREVQMKMPSVSHMVHSKQGGAYLRGPRGKKLPKPKLMPQKGVKLSSLATRAPMPEEE